MIGNSFTEHRLHKTRPQCRLKEEKQNQGCVALKNSSTNQWCLRLVIVNFIAHSKQLSLSPHGGSRVMISTEDSDNPIYLLITPTENIHK